MATDNATDEVYGKSFFDDIEAGSTSSAAVVVPIVLDLVAPDSVLDVGCGCGAWLKTFIDLGISNARGVDGDYVKREQLLIPPSCFSPVDLSSAFTLPRPFSLATCLEVAEHLPATQADRLVRELTQSADVVLFSAAVPGQGGTFHVNEQWPAYWIERFAGHGFIPFDTVRSKIRDNHRVCWWYRQNLLLFVAQSRLSLYPKIVASSVATLEPLEWVHYEVFKGYATPKPQPDPSVKTMLRMFPRIVGNSIRFRMSRMKNGSAGSGE